MSQRAIIEFPVVDGMAWLDATLVWHFPLDDVVLAVLWATLLTVLRIVIASGLKASLRSSGALRNTQTINKFSESVWKTLFYTISLSWGTYIGHKNQWTIENLSTGYPNIPYSDDARIFYLFSLGFYLHSLFVQFWLETRRSDFWEMALHHIVTSFLIVFSWGIGAIPIGILLMVLHDASDVVFEVAKLCVYLKRELLADCVFGFWVLSWTILRMWLFPCYIIPTVYYESFQVVNLMPVHPHSSRMIAYPFLGLLVTLYCLHWFWYIMIMKLIWSKLTGNTLRDPREADADKDE